ncbi:dihydrolipoamide acetyltransferase family protein [Streptomyces sp. NPDC057702]|uniref:dihydrolipoamide acetyltransferase family protein n=1 Tax=unclassified Streptomyces TaxID=2593676 RepID=UPI0036C435CD
MAVVREFALPDLGEGLTEAEIVRWLVAVGDVVAVDQPVVEVETAKAMVEVPCPYGGVVTARFGEEGTELPVGAALLTVAVGDTAEPAGPSTGGPSTAGPGAGGPGAADSADTTDPGISGDGADGAEGSGNVLVGYGTGAPAARRRRLRAGKLTPVARVPESVGVATGAPRDAGPAAGSAPDGRDEAAREVDARPGARGAAGPSDATPGAGATATGSVATAEVGAANGVVPPRRLVPVISPLVRRLAREHGLDLGAVAGTGPDGLILRSDVERAVAAAGAPDAAARPGLAGERAGGAARAVSALEAERQRVPAGGSGALGHGHGHDGALGAERIPLRGVRGAVAEKLSRSRREIPEATCWVDADATELLAARTAMNEAGDPRVSLLAVLARICTAALARFPELNSTVDTEAREIVRLPAVHLGFAAQTDRGLMVPVVRDAHRRDVVDLSAEFARLTESARAGRLTPAELTGGTFTLNNYGVFGVDGSTPIINHPEAAMLGVGRIADRPWVHRGELAVRRVVQLSLTFDHRVCDGGVAGGFLRYVADCVEQPAVLLRTL